jgi:hypothetical protein
MSGTGAMGPERLDPARRTMTMRIEAAGVGVALDRRGIWYITQLYVLPRADH